jgi:hypothetical protein
MPSVEGVDAGVALDVRVDAAVGRAALDGEVGIEAAKREDAGGASSNSSAAGKKLRNNPSA